MFSYSDDRRTKRALKYVKIILPLFCAVEMLHTKNSHLLRNLHLCFQNINIGTSSVNLIMLSVVKVLFSYIVMY